MVNEKDNPVRAITFLYDGDLVDLFEENSFDGFTVDIEEQSEFAFVSLTRKMKGSGEDYDEDGYRYIKGKFYLFSQDETDAYTIFTISNSDFYTYGLKKYLKKFRSDISMSFLDSTDLKILFEALDDNIDGNIIATDVVIKSPREGTEVKYFDNKPYYSIFNNKDIVNGDYYVDKIGFKLENSGNSFQGQVSRTAESRFESGKGSIYFKYVLKLLSSCISDKGEIFSNKARNYGSREANPIQIIYEQGAIEGREEKDRLIRVLDGLSRSSLTVYHDNSYMHASILDYNDGTTADVFLNSDNSISIIPGFNASRQSLTRLIKQIIEEFREGKISEGEQSELEFTEYFSEV